MTALSVAVTVIFLSISYYLRGLKPSVVWVQLSFSEVQFRQLLSRWTPDDLRRFRRHFAADYLFIFAYGVMGYASGAKVLDSTLAGPPRLAAARPGQAVVKSGRTTGVTRGLVTAIRVNGVQVNYGTRQNPIIATFDGTIQIAGNAGAGFIAPGDSGSVILDANTGEAVALLFAGDGVTTSACDLTAACTRFGVVPA